MCRCALIGFWVSVLGTLTAVAVALVCGGIPALALGAATGCLALGLGALLCLTAMPQQATLGKILTGSVDRARPGDPDLLLDLDAVKIAGVYRLGGDLLAYLRGGTGLRTDEYSGLARAWQAGSLFLTWRGAGRLSTDKLVHQLNTWQSSGAPVRLVGAKGRCAVLMDEDDHCLVLPELAAHLGDGPRSTWSGPPTGSP